MLLYKILKIIDFQAHFHPKIGFKRKKPVLDAFATLKTAVFDAIKTAVFYDVRIDVWVFGRTP
ncbi:MAG: hypothetical protein AAF614_20700 [Chloroflexota bacterium]